MLLKEKVCVFSFNLFLGVCSWPNGNKYEGQWSQNMMNGYGVFTWPDNKRYEGTYVNNKKEGQGTMTWYY